MSVFTPNMILKCVCVCICVCVCVCVCFWIQGFKVHHISQAYLGRDVDIPHMKGSISYFSVSMGECVYVCVCVSVVPNSLPFRKQAVSQEAWKLVLHDGKESVCLCSRATVPLACHGPSRLSDPKKEGETQRDWALDSEKTHTRTHTHRYTHTHTQTHSKELEWEEWNGKRQRDYGSVVPSNESL